MTALHLFHIIPFVPSFESGEETIITLRTDARDMATLLHAYIQSTPRVVSYMVICGAKHSILTVNDKDAQSIGNAVSYLCAYSL